jgi:predicted RNA-binding Zn-ribbon protein involved in translation (DUF1610 family)
MSSGSGLVVAAVLNSYARKSKEKTVYLKDEFNNIKDLSEKYKDLISEVEELISAIELPESEKKCPECGKNFSIIKINEIELNFCGFCQSFWFDSGKLKEITEARTEIPARDLKYRLSKFKCPVCKKSMEEHLFIRKNNI